MSTQKQFRPIRILHAWDNPGYQDKDLIVQNIVDEIRRLESTKIATLTHWTITEDTNGDLLAQSSTGPTNRLRLTAAGALSVSGTANVSGATTLQANLSVSGTANVSGATTLQGALNVSGTATLAGTVAHTGTMFGAFGVSPVTRPSAFTVTNDSTNRTLDVSTVTLTQLANVVATLLRDQNTLGWEHVA